jgi:hypothetical protein
LQLFPLKLNLCFFGKGRNGKEAQGMAAGNGVWKKPASKAQQSFGKGRRVCGRIRVGKQIVVSLG